MIMWPATTVPTLLQILGVSEGRPQEQILWCWIRSTPLSPYANNAVGMPAGSSGAMPYAGSGYACFPDTGTFYQAFANWAKSSAGHDLTQALEYRNPEEDSWLVISRLNWPGSKTETDYPGLVLDLCPEDFRIHAGTTEPADRKTSGMVSHALQGLAARPTPLTINARRIARMPGTDGSMWQK